MKSCIFLQSIATLLLASLAGCAGLNDCCYENSQKARAVRQYIECGNAKCEKFPHDYKLGWIDGFYNGSTGGPACPPAVAPQRYWDPKQILDQCDNRRHAYYSGWQDGASRAGQFPDTHHLKIFETCECPMPRCDSTCGPGGCVPCGLGSVGSPVHAELIEMPYEQESIMPTPVVPTAPATHEQASNEPELEMLETDPIEAEANEVDSNESNIAMSASTMSKVQETEKASVNLPEPEAADSTVRLVEDNLVPPSIEKAVEDKTTNKTVAKSNPSKAKTSELSKVTVKRPTQATARPTRHPAIARVTIPVRFEMIESDDASVVQAK